ncbi:MAG: amidohydrolase family protein, partial [Spirochaetota bacterium]
GPEEVATLISALARSGTTRHFPTIITNSENQILHSLKSIAQARKSSDFIAHSIPGIHLEGPFISTKEGPRGVHNPAYIRPADIDEYRRWQEAAEGLIQIVTLSPEDEQALQFIRAVSADGVVVGIGHTQAPPEMIERAVAAGAQLSVHLGNGSPSMVPRLKNFIWRQLGEDRLRASLIADGHHLPEEVLRCFIRGKGLENTILISDAAPLAGSPPGLYQWGGMDVEIFDDGHMGLHNTENLAGAAHLLDTGIAVTQKATSLSLADCVRLATINPCRLTGLQTWTTAPHLGEPANIILFQYDNGELSVHKAIHHNNILFARE